jgi:hypothetical protein
MRESLLRVGLAATLLLGLVAGTCVAVLSRREASAVIGRPLTPMSYAGVARRTARRSAYVGAAYGAPTITALPAGCGFAVGIYTCGAVRYRPYYDGPTVVYQVVQ